MANDGVNHKPRHLVNKFMCPHCDTVATQRWFEAGMSSGAIVKIIENIYLDYRPGLRDQTQTTIKYFIQEINKHFRSNLYQFLPQYCSVATCLSCNNFTLWVNQKMVYPKITTVPPPNDDLNEDSKALYSEAALILSDSPRGAAALLRLALEKLLRQVGKSGKNINNDIKSLVDDGLDPDTQKALDLVRIIGNNAVHSGQINLDDNAEIAHGLFYYLNTISEELITRPNELKARFSKLVPSEIQDQIKRRNGK